MQFNLPFDYSVPWATILLITLQVFCKVFCNSKYASFSLNLINQGQISIINTGYLSVNIFTFLKAN